MKIETNACAWPGCTAVIPTELNGRGPLGWHQFFLTCVSLASMQRVDAIPFNVALCPAHSTALLALVY